MNASDRNAVALAAEPTNADRLELREVVWRNAEDLELARCRVVDGIRRADIPDLEAPLSKAERREVERVPRVVDPAWRVANVFAPRVAAERDAAEIDARRCCERDPGVLVTPPVDAEDVEPRRVPRGRRVGAEEDGILDVARLATRGARLRAPFRNRGGTEA